ncbi:thioesterase [Streptacidiphilus sp. 4-A2]|nr:thioesterase [Streptacidiphilus sp. 4-A2]
MTGRSPWLLCREPRPQARMRLYCLPHSGGSAGEFLFWADGLPGYEVWGVQPPGRGERIEEEPYTAMPELVRALADEAEFTGPYALFGHSLGAAVAYELASELRARGRELPAGSTSPGTRRRICTAATRPCPPSATRSCWRSWARATTRYRRSCARTRSGSRCCWPASAPTCGSWPTTAAPPRPTRCRCR